MTGEKCISSGGVVKENVLAEYLCNHPNRIRGRYVFLTIADLEAIWNVCEVLVYAVYECEYIKRIKVIQSYL